MCTSGILQSSNYSPHEVFWGQLAGCMEAIDAGTTTVVDHSHLNYSPDHRKGFQHYHVPGELYLVRC